MCGRYSITTPVEALRQLFRFSGPLPNLRPRYNVAPTQQVPIVRGARDNGARELAQARWDLIPFWAKDAKIEDQEEFIRWWREHVRRDGRPGETVADRGLFSVENAEHVTGIANQQVSRWGKYLADKPKYRERLILAAYRKAGLAPTSFSRPATSRTMPSGCASSRRRRRCSV